MTRPRRAYELSESQVTTPLDVVSLFWRVAQQHRASFDSVLDLGAGDCRFSRGGSIRRYVGIEIDRKRVESARVPRGGSLIHGCAFRHTSTGYDACIGNPPYVRHHDIHAAWKEKTVASIERELGISLSMHCNLYIYFFCLALLKAKSDGLVALVIPYEWVSRPSAAALRDHIRVNRWNVAVYRFTERIFDGVMTTASISIVDKASRNSRWTFNDVTPSYRLVRREGIVDSSLGVLHYQDRGSIWALRGLSPGSQSVFTLTEGERIRNGLKKNDVQPCVTSLRTVPSDLKTLTSASFRKHYVASGRKCWLIRSSDRPGHRLSAYLASVPAKARQTYTCKNQDPWFKYRPHPVPQIVVGSGFTKFGPKVLINSVGARAVGSVWGIHAQRKLPNRRLQKFLLSINFESRVVAHAKRLKKIEVKQLNTVLNGFDRRERRNGREDSR